jgi:glycosyltransferase involved in cell wall biosynthesis
LFTVYNYYKRNRLFSKDEEFYVQLEKHLPLVVHDGSIDFISEEELVKKYAIHRCFVDGSVERRMTNAFLQALALGMPCIVVKSTHDNNKMVIDRKSGFIVSNVEEAVEQGRVLLEDFSLAEEFHNVALQVREDFINPNTCKRKWTELFEEALVIGP